VFTAAEAAAVAAIYALLVAAFIYRALSWKFLREALLSTAIINSAIYSLIAMANIAAFIFAIAQSPQKAVLGLTSLPDNPYLILLMVNLILPVLGMFLDTIGILSLTVPALTAIGSQLGIDPVHLGMMVVFNVLIGFVISPVGLCLFGIAGMTGLDCSCKASKACRLSRFDFAFGIRRRCRDLKLLIVHATISCDTDARPNPQQRLSTVARGWPNCGPCCLHFRRRLSPSLIPPKGG
jgi:hypothetical protein